MSDARHNACAAGAQGSIRHRAPAAIRNPPSLIRWLVVSLLVPSAATLHAQVDPRGDWRTWHTPHFRIHTRVENAAVARLAAVEAERAYAALAAELKPPRGIVDLTLHDNVDFSNGFATVFPSNRIVVFLTPPASEIGLGRYDEWLRLVITHELTHVFHLDRAEGFWRVMQWGFGRAPVLFPNLYRPAWITEGLATYYESRLTAGGRGRGAFHGQLLLAAARADRWPRAGDVNFSNPRWPGPLGPYAWGSRFFGWVALVHGDTVVSRFIDHTSKRFWPLTISGPLKQAGGGGLRADWEGLRAALQPVITGGSSRPPASTSSTIVARGLRAEPRTRLSPDGRKLAYVVSDGRSRERVVIRDLAGSQVIATVGVNGSPELAWVGDDLVLAELDFTTPVEIRSRLHRWAPGGASRRPIPIPRLTRPFALTRTDIGAVALSPAGTTLVRVTGDSVLDAIPAPDADAWAHVSVSPDGRLIAGARHANAKWDIVFWPAGSPTLMQVVTDDAALDDDPAWSPDGGELIFSSERSGMPQLFAYRLSTRSVTQLTNEPTGAREGELGPGGTLFFSTLLDDGYAVLSTGRAEVPTAGPAVVPAPAIRLPEPTVATESRYSPWRSLLPRYWLPLFHDAGSVGRFLGAGTSGADVVGRTSYALGVAHALSGDRWEGFLSAWHSRWSAMSLDFTAQQLWDLGGRMTLSPTAIDVQVSERDRALSAGATLRWRRWRSEVSARLGGEVTQDAFFVPVPNVQFQNPTFTGGVASFLAGYTQRHALSISTENGALLSGLYRRRWVAGGDGWSDEMRGVLRGYLALSLPGFSRWVLAGRLAAAMSGGPNARNFALGGESGTTYAVIPGLGFGSGIRDFGLRGYPRDGSRFTRVVTGVAEVRVPLFLIGKAIWKLPLTLDKVSVSVFGEMGGGWRQESGPRALDQYRDVGAELVLDLGLNLDSPIRVRVGGAQALTTGLGANQGDWRGYVALGSAF